MTYALVINMKLYNYFQVLIYIPYTGIGLHIFHFLKMRLGWPSYALCIKLK